MRGPPRRPAPAQAIADNNVDLIQSGLAHAFHQMRAAAQPVHAKVVALDYFFLPAHYYAENYGTNWASEKVGALLGGGRARDRGGGTPRRAPARLPATRGDAGGDGRPRRMR